MEFAKRMIVAVEKLPLPDFVSQAGIHFMVGRSRQALNRPDAPSDAEFLELVASRPIAVLTGKAIEQHYEIPAEFYDLILGPHRK
ncbi:MAG: hypothetical protein AB7J19_05220 [Beijerinckiaceae bacterium]